MVQRGSQVFSLADQGLRSQYRPPSEWKYLTALVSSHLRRLDHGPYTAISAENASVYKGAYSREGHTQSAMANAHAHESHQVFANSATPYSNPRPTGERVTAEAVAIFSSKALVNNLWFLFDTVVLFRMGTIYLHRFEDFKHCTHTTDPTQRDLEITLWRDEQQKEWDRLSITASEPDCIIVICSHNLRRMCTRWPCWAL